MGGRDGADPTRVRAPAPCNVDRFPFLCLHVTSIRLPSWQPLCSCPAPSMPAPRHGPSPSLGAHSIRAPAPALTHRPLKPTAGNPRRLTLERCGRARRGIILRSVNAVALASLLSIGAVERPKGLGVQDYGGGVKTLALCPPSPNCISTAEELNDIGHYVPPL